MGRPHTWVDGAVTDRVPADDRGLNYADGAFETLACKEGSIQCLSLHHRRLADAFEGLSFSDPVALATDTFEQAAALLAGVDHTGIARLTVTRGSGPRGYAPSAAAKPRCILVAHEVSDQTSTPLQCGIARTRWAAQPQLAGLKLLARTEQVLAASEALASGWDDAVMLDANDRVISGSRGNIFLIKNGFVVTPCLNHCGIAGTRRQLMLEHILPSCGFEAAVREIDLDEFRQADAVFMTNTVVGLRPVGSIADKVFASASAAQAVEDLQRALAEHLRSCFGA